MNKLRREYRLFLCVKFRWTCVINSTPMFVSRSYEYILTEDSKQNGLGTAYTSTVFYTHYIDINTSKSPKSKSNRTQVTVNILVFSGIRNFFIFLLSFKIHFR